MVTPQGEIRFASVDARCWLKEFFPRPARAGLLPRKISRWLAEGGAEAGKPSLVIKHENFLLFVRGMKLHPDDSIALLLERVAKGARDIVRTHGKLTASETEVLSWIAYGKSDNHIARILDRSTGTIGKHVGHILAKLGVENRAGAAVEFYRAINGTAK